MVEQFFLRFLELVFGVFGYLFVSFQGYGQRFVEEFEGVVGRVRVGFFGGGGVDKEFQVVQVELREGRQGVVFEAVGVGVQERVFVLDFVGVFRSLGERNVGEFFRQSRYVFGGGFYERKKFGKEVVVVGVDS